MNKEKIDDILYDLRAWLRNTKHGCYQPFRFLKNIWLFRKEIWENQKKYIGKTIEFKGMLVGAKDLIRHPVFLRFRSDK